MNSINLFQEETKQRILKEYETTRNFAEIARRLNMSVYHVFKYAEEMDIKPSKYIWVDEDTVKCSKCFKLVAFADLELIRPNGKSPSRISYCRQCRTGQVIANNKSSLKRHLMNRIRAVRTRSKTQGIKFELTVENLEELYVNQNGKCFYTDLELVVQSNPNKEGEDRYRLSMDKIIPSLGYVKGNVVLCTVRANNIKGDATMDEMKIWLPDWHKRLLKART